jgi:eukaryotic-like serine/threonine-protein kinase
VTSHQGDSSQAGSPARENEQQASGAAEARKKAAERLGQWVNKKYCLESLLGVGGMATVYAAKHRNGARIALKILHSEFAREEAVKARFLREGYVANKVEHSGVVKILDDDETEQGEPFLVMELLEGETLQQLWKRRNRKVPVGEALHIAIEVLDTLVPFHDLSIIHRDLKPANIFITHDGEVKLLDFGVAQMREHGEAMTRAGTALGTPSFMSPEQAMGKSDQLDGRSDVFSVGATLYAILSGKRLHHGKSDNEAFILAATQPAPSLARVAPELPVEVIALVDKALQWDRRKRFATSTEMRDVARVLRQKLGGEPGADTIVTGLSDVPRPSAPTIAYTPEARRQATSPLEHLAESHPPTGATPPPTGTPPPVTGTSQARAMPPPPPTRRPSAIQKSLTPSLGPAAATDAEASVDKDPLIGFFERFEKQLATLRAYGLDHPEGQAKIRTVYSAMIDVLREDPEALSWSVHPFCFSHDTTTVWEPGAPYDGIPYNLASSGVEEIRIKAGVTELEVRTFLKHVVIDPQIGLTEGGDIGAALWEARFEHIFCKVRDDVVDADAREQIRFFADTAEVEDEVKRELARVVMMMAHTPKPALGREDHAEVAAMALTTETDSFAAARKATDLLRVDAATRATLSADLGVVDDEWRERFYDVAAQAFADAAMRQDLPLVHERVREHADQLIGAGKWEESFTVVEALADRVARVPARARHGVEADQVLQRAWPIERLRAAFAAAAEESRPLERRKAIGTAIARTLSRVGPALVRDLVRLADDLQKGELFDLCIAYVEQNLRLARADVVEMLDHVRPELAQRLLALVAADPSGDATTVLQPLLMSANPALRCEATAHVIRSADELGRQLNRMLTSTDARLRSAALHTMVRHQVRAAGPGLVGLIEDQGFAARPEPEQRQMLQTLYALNPPRAESLLTALVSQHGLMADEKLDRMRTLAAEVLGALADSSNPLDALDGAARLRPWNTQGLRSAATEAMETIRTRLRGAAAGADA